MAGKSGSLQMQDSSSSNLNSFEKASYFWNYLYIFTLAYVGPITQNAIVENKGLGADSLLKSVWCHPGERLHPRWVGPISTYIWIDRQIAQVRRTTIGAKKPLDKNEG